MHMSKVIYFYLTKGIYISFVQVLLQGLDKYFNHKRQMLLSVYYNEELRHGERFRFLPKAIQLVNSGAAFEP